MKVLITGSKGQLGESVKHFFVKEHVVYAWDFEELDFTDSSESYEKIVNLNPDLVIHCGAYTDVPGCELNPEKAYLTNSLGTRNIAIPTALCDATLVYISTDYVFDGIKDSPYLEFDQPNPLNIYGHSKLVGEKMVQELVKKYYIIRTSWLFSPIKKNFVKTILRLTQEQDELTIVQDQIGVPTFTKDLARAIKTIISKPFYGIYHVANTGFCSWCEFAEELVRLKGLEERVKVKGICSKDYGDVVQRPAYSVLRNFNLEMTYGYQMRDWRLALQECLADMN